MSRSIAFVAVLTLVGCSAAPAAHQLSGPAAIYGKDGQKLPDRLASSDQVNWVTVTKNTPDYLSWNGVGEIDPGCTATLLEAPAGSTAPAYLITAGHCFPSGELDADEIVVGQRVSATAELGQYVANSGAPAPVEVEVDRAEYATMKGTDVAILRVSSATSYAKLISRGLHPRRIATEAPTEGLPIIMAHEPAEGVRTRGLRLSSCVVGASADLHEDRYEWQGTFRNHCSAVGGSSGAPVMNAETGEIVGLLTTGTRDSTAGSPDCVDSRPCELHSDGTHQVFPEENYAQHVYQVAGCFDAHGAFDLDAPGCGLEKP